MRRLERRALVIPRPPGLQTRTKCPPVLGTSERRTEVPVSADGASLRASFMIRSTFCCTLSASGRAAEVVRSSSLLGLSGRGPPPWPWCTCHKPSGTSHRSSRTSESLPARITRNRAGFRCRVRSQPLALWYLSLPALPVATVLRQNPGSGTCLGRSKGPAAHCERCKGFGV